MQEPAPGEDQDSLLTVGRQTIALLGDIYDVSGLTPAFLHASGIVPADLRCTQVQVSTGEERTTIHYGSLSFQMSPEAIWISDSAADGLYSPTQRHAMDTLQITARNFLVAAPFMPVQDILCSWQVVAPLPDAVAWIRRNFAPRVQLPGLEYMLVESKFGVRVGEFRMDFTVERSGRGDLPGSVVFDCSVTPASYPTMSAMFEFVDQAQEWLVLGAGLINHFIAEGGQQNDAARPRR